VDVVKNNSDIGNLDDYLYSIYLFILFVLDASSGVFTINLISNLRNEKCFDLLQSFVIIPGQSFNDLMNVIRQSLPSALPYVYTKLMIGDELTMPQFDQSKWNDVLTQELFWVDNNMYLNFSGIYIFLKSN